MRILHLTPGTGSFYCGTCIRDNALVRALRRLGHDVVLLPLYLPLVTDETPAPTDQPIFFGGLNVYLQHKYALFRRLPPWMDRLLDSPRLLRRIARRAGMTQAHELGDLTLSMLRGQEGRQAKELDRLIAHLAREPRFDMVMLSNALLVGLVRRIKRDLRVPVVCSLQGEDAFVDALTQPYRGQVWEALRQCCAEVDGFVAISHYYGRVMRERLNLPSERVHVVPNGIDLDGYAPATAAPDPPAIGYLARLCRGKGLETLVEAFVILKRADRVKGLRLKIAGSAIPADEPFIGAMRDKLATAGLAGDVEFHLNVDRPSKLAFLRSLTVLSVPATYGEAFGLYVLEALASGVPVVQPRHAAFPELLQATGGGILCAPDDPASLAEALATLLLDPGRARILGQRGREAVIARFSVERMAGDVAEVCRKTMMQGRSLAPER